MLMTKAAYARHKGVSRQTVYDWIARGELVLVGGKIDAIASEQKATGFVTPAAWRDDSKRVNISPKARFFSQDSDYSEEKNQVIPVSPDDAAATVQALDDVYPPATTYEELQTRIFDAVDALVLKIKTLDIEGDEEHKPCMTQSCIARWCALIHSCGADVSPLIGGVKTAGKTSLKFVGSQNKFYTI